MRYLILFLLILIPQLNLAAPQDDAVTVNGEKMSRIDAVSELRTSPHEYRPSPSIRACTYYPADTKIYDIARLEIHSKTCESDIRPSDKLPDRPDSEIYNVGEPFGVPKRN